MNGYNTGWKFDGWYDAPTCAQITTSGEAVTRNSVGVAAPLLGGTDPAVMAPGSTSIMVHGYNSIRIRCAVTSSVAADTVGVIQWQVFLLESDAEEDQSANFWMATPFCCFLTNAPSGVGVVTGYSNAKTSVQNVAGKTWAIMSHQYRVIQVPGGAGTEAANDIDEQEAWSSQYFYNASGLDVKNGQATIDATTGLPGTAIINRRFANPVYTPGMSGVSATSSSSGELYINNLAGAARLIIQPRLHLPYNAIVRNGQPLQVGNNVAVNAKSVGVFYNLIQ